MAAFFIAFIVSVIATTVWLINLTARINRLEANTRELAEIDPRKIIAQLRGYETSRRTL